MRCVGIDPGTAVCGWALLDGTRLLDAGTVDLRGGKTWRQKLECATVAFAEVIAKHEPGLVAVEKTQMPRPQEGDGAARGFSMAVLTQHTEELAGVLMVLAVSAGAQVVRVTPHGSLSALGCKRGAKDREVVEAYTRLFGRKLLVRDHHIARAAGVALRGQAQARLAAAREKEAVS